MRGLQWSEAAGTQPLKVVSEPKNAGAPQRLAKDSFHMRASEWIQACHNRGLAPSSTQIYHTQLVKLSEFCKGAPITVKLLSKFFIMLKDSGYSRNSLARAKMVVKSFFTWCVSHGYVEDNPTDGLSVTLPPKTYKREVFSHKEYEQLKDYTRDSCIYCAVVLGYNTGMRISDVIGSKWSWIDLERQEVVYTPVKTRKHNTKVVVPIVPGGDLYELIYDLLPQASSPDDPLCKPLAEMGQQKLSVTFRSILWELGISGKSFHTFRRTFVTNVMCSGVDSHLAMSMTGIRNHNTLMHYMVPKPDALRRAIEQAHEYAKTT